MKNKKKLNKAFAWCCDSSPYRGEGILGIKFARMLIDKDVFESIEVQDPHQKKFLKKKVKNDKKETTYKKINHNFFFKYITPFIGLFKIWINHFNYKPTIYINFLPLWNFPLFLLLPSKTILGPITGSIYSGKIINIDTFLRKYLINFFYYISIVILSFKYKNLIFATDNLKNFLTKKIIKKSIFNFQFYNFQFYKNKKKSIDILFYYRNHQNKFTNDIINILRKIKNKKIKIYIVGDYLEGFKNLGIISRFELLNYLKKTKFTFLSIENTYSFFCLDAISCNVNIINIYQKSTKIFSNFFVKKNNSIINRYYIDPTYKLKKIDIISLQFLEYLNNSINKYINKIK